jgi:hypothetical protein
MALVSMCLGNTLHINVYVFSVPYVINVKLPPTGTLTLMAKQTMTLMGSKSLTLMSMVRALQHRGGAGGTAVPAQWLIAAHALPQPAQWPATGPAKLAPHPGGPFLYRATRTPPVPSMHYYSATSGRMGRPH